MSERGLKRFEILAQADDGLNGVTTIEDRTEGQR